MDPANLNKTLVQNILERAHSFPWKMQEIGLLGLRLDQQRKFRLHVWAPVGGHSASPIHDHPYDFVSSIVVGELSNTRYQEDSSGTSYRRERYSLPDENDRICDSIPLVGTSEIYREGDVYSQLAHELHDSTQLPGTVTVLQMTPKDIKTLTVCRPDDGPWISGVSRPATHEEIDDITAKALTWF